MKPFGIRAEQRGFEQQYYGGYCNKAREYDVNPMSYVKFQDSLDKLLDQDMSKKQRMNKLIEMSV